MPGGQSGNGWAACEQGHQHWGLFGAAGLLAYVAHPTDQAQSLVLLQHRTRWSHQGGTWALPGGAMDSDETPAEAALREADEEVMLDPKLVVPRGLYSDEHGGWAYHTVLAQAAEPLRVRSDAYESDDAVWLPADQVDQLDLHPGFAASWPVLREALVPLTVFVDGADGSSAQPGSGAPADAGRRLYARLGDLTRSGLRVLPDGVGGPVLERWYPDYVLVLAEQAAAAAVSAAAADGEAREALAASRPSWNEVLTVRTAEVRIVAVTDPAQASVVMTDLTGTTPGRRLVVSDRRVVRDRAAAAGAAVTDLNWLLGQRATLRSGRTGQAAACPPTSDRTVVPTTTTAWRHPDMSIEQEKQVAAEAAAELVENGMTVGLGTGSTVAYLLPALARRSLDILCAATSPATEHAARELGLRIEAVTSIDRFDITIDGADQISPDGWLVKGGGGAHNREKIVAGAADRFVVIADSSKPVPALHSPVPLELMSFGLRATMRRVAPAALRDVPLSPDGGVIADYHGPVEDPAALAIRLSSTPGVVAHGLFPPQMVAMAFVGAGKSADRIDFTPGG